MAVADRHDLPSLTASSRANGSAPSFGPGERGVDEGSGQIDLAAVSQVFGESLEQDLKASGSLPQGESDEGRSDTADSGGRSCHGAPVRKTQRTAHCISVRSMPPNAARRSCRWAR